MLNTGAELRLDGRSSEDGGQNSGWEGSKLRMNGKQGWLGSGCGIPRMLAEEFTPSNDEDLVTVSRKKDVMKTVL